MTYPDARVLAHPRPFPVDSMYPSYPLGVWNTTDGGASVNHIEYAANVNASRARCMSAATSPPCVWTHDLWTNKTLELLAEQVRMRAGGLTGVCRASQ